MSVKDLFENCGYKLYANNDNLICYTHGDGKRIKFKLKQRKLTLHTDVDMELLKAINCQCYLLGWIGEITMKCENCAHYDGKYCCSGFIEDEDVTIKEIGRRVQEAEDEGYLVDWSVNDCPAFEPDYDDSFEDIAFETWRERYGV